VNPFGTLFQLLPLAVNLGVSGLFLTTLRRGKTPLVTALATMEQGKALTPRFAIYTRRLTAAWGLLLILLGVTHLVIEWADSWWIASWLIDWIAIGLFFLVEFAWRIFRFPGFQFASPWTLFRLVQRQGGLYRLYRRCMT